jgi:hypothetical protein
MTRITEAALLNFCTQQHTCFQPQAWLAYPHPVREELAAAALFLAAVDWYGHRKALQEIASTLEPGCVGHFAALAKRAGFDCGRFSNSLRHSLRHAPLAS